MGDAIEAADEKATAPGHKADVEDDAVYIWLKGHRISSQAGHSLALVVDPGLPQPWRDKAVAFASQGDAVAYLGKLHLDAAAIGLLKKAVVSMPQDPQPPQPVQRGLPGPTPPPARGVSWAARRQAELDGLFGKIAPQLAAGRCWIIPVVHPPCYGVGKTDPAVYGRVNSALGTRVDFASLSQHEGGQWRRGYVPIRTVTGKVVGASGMTVATGFDVGQWFPSDLKDKLGLRQPILDKLRFFTRPELGDPHLSLPMVYRYSGGSSTIAWPPRGVVPTGPFPGMTKIAVAKKVADTAPVPELTKEEADTVDEAVHRQMLSEIRDGWDHRGGRTAPTFVNLPANWQTVLMSRYFQQGRRFLVQAPGGTFLDQATKGDWRSALATFERLRNHPNLAQYEERLKDEARLLRSETPAPTRPDVPAALAKP